MKPKTKLSPLQKVAMAMFVLACLAVFTIFRFLDYPVASWQLNREYERARKNGIPLIQAELKPKGIDEKQNAAPELVRIGKLVEAEWRKERDKDSKLNANDLGIRICLPFVNDFTMATNKPSYWSDTDYDLGSLLEQPELGGYRTMVGALNQLAKNDAKSGKWKDSLAKISTTFRLSKLLESSPSWYGQNTSRYALRTGLRTIELLASSSIGNRGRLQDLLALTKSIDPRDCTKEALIGDNYMWIATLRNTHWYGGAKAFVDSFGAYSDPPDPSTEPRVTPPIIRDGEPSSMIARALLAKRLAFFNDAVESKEWRTDDYKGLAMRMNLYSERKSALKTFRVSDRLNTYLMPESGTGTIFEAKCTSKKTVALLIESLLFRAHHGRFPTDLRQISADLADPYLPNKNLHYRTDGKSVAIWSVGTNLVDDGGHKDKSGDIGAYYPAYKPIH